MNVDQVQTTVPPARFVPAQYSAEGRSQTMAEWAKELGVATNALRNRFQQLHDFGDAVAHYRAEQIAALRAPPLQSVSEEESRLCPPPTPADAPNAPRPPPLPRTPSAGGTAYSLHLGACEECAARAANYYQMIHHDHVRAGALPLMGARAINSPPVVNERYSDRMGFYRYLPASMQPQRPAAPVQGATSHQPSLRDHLPPPNAAQQAAERRAAMYNGLI